jgi:ATP-dependent helicase/DNAse subunit B
LETYARCPFRYFLTVVLGLSESEEPEQILSLQPRDRGALLHGVLHEFFTQARDAGWLPLADAERSAARRLLQQIAARHFANFARLGATGFSLLWEIEQERMLERLLGLLEREYETGESFLPAAFEVRFGADTHDVGDEHGEHGAAVFPDGPVRLQLDSGEDIALRGRIDRIDLSADQQRARIVDYKTGKRVGGRFAGGTALQLPLYLYAARFLWPERVWESAFYAYVGRDHKPAPMLFTAANWDSSVATLRAVITKLTQSLRGGCFAATPDACFPCPFPLICGGQVEHRALRKQQDARLELLRQVRTVE